MRFLVRSRWSILLTFRNLIDRAPSDNRAGRCDGAGTGRPRGGLATTRAPPLEKPKIGTGIGTGPVRIDRYGKGWMRHLKSKNIDRMGTSGTVAHGVEWGN